MTGIWDSITVNASSLIQTLIQNEVRLSLIILLVVILDHVWRHWAPRPRYALWLLALVLALWPPSFNIAAITIWPTAPMPLLPISLVANSSPEITRTGGIDTASVMLIFWGAASALMMLWIAFGFLDLRWNLRHAEPLGISTHILDSFLTRRKPQILVSDWIRSPLTTGLVRPKIYLTPAAAHLEEHTLRAILHHEAAHIIRHDRWIILVQILALILHPFNPLVWLMNRRLARYREQICDDFALHYADITPVTYGHLLLDYVTQGVFNRPVLLPQTLFCESRNDLRQRLTQLLNRKETTMNRTSILQKMSLVAILLGMVFISSQCQEKNSTLSLQEQHDLQAALTESSPDFVPKGSSGLTEEEQKQRQAALKEMGVEFVPYDEPPVPVGGYGVLSKLLKYPEEAKEKGITGLVSVHCQVLADGRTGRVVVGENQTGDESLAKAALAAVGQITWTPAKQRDRNVAVWVAIPINFSLDDKPVSGMKKN
ncbi:MAG: M56 family metallopeptidase [Fidelibacterota bacterium]|nr:MAG: M56 family metallopeptidase [Candidatus Neomarinimicrobiota bacterium]